MADPTTTESCGKVATQASKVATTDASCTEKCTAPAKSAIVKSDHDEDLKISVPPIPKPKIPEDVGIVTEEDPVLGKGQFDKYMRATANQIDIEYQLGRIKGADIAALWGELLPHMMAEANKFVIAEHASRINAETEAIKIEEIRAEGILKRQLLSVQIASETMKIRHLQLQMDETLAKTQLVTTQETEARKSGISKRMLEKYQANEVLAKTQLVTTQESEARRNGAVERSYKAAQEELTCTQAAELVLNGTSKRTLEAEEINVKKKMVTLYEKQAESFVLKSQGDVFKTISNMWAVYASENGLDSTNSPSVMAKTNMDDMITSASSPVNLATP